MRRPNDTKKLDVLKMFIKEVAYQKNEGRSLVFVDAKLLEWVDEQVEAGKYPSRSHAIEYAVATLKDGRRNRRGPEILDSPSAKHRPQTKSSPFQMERRLGDDPTERFIAGRLTVEELVLEISKRALRNQLHEKYGTDMTAWSIALQRLLSDDPDLSELDIQAAKAVWKEAVDKGTR